MCFSTSEWYRFKSIQGSLHSLYIDCTKQYTAFKYYWNLTRSVSKRDTIRMSELLQGDHFLPKDSWQLRVLGIKIQNFSFMCHIKRKQFKHNRSHVHISASSSWHNLKLQKFMSLQTPSAVRQPLGWVGLTTSSVWAAWRKETWRNWTCFSISVDELAEFK